jgi:cobalamin biosynthesis protein CbiD
VENLQSLLKDSTDKYGDLESKYNSAVTLHSSSIQARDEELSTLKKELSRANGLLESIEKSGMTDEMIESLSPAAAKASAILKGTKSITEIFSNYQDVCKEIVLVKNERDKLRAFINEVLKVGKTINH